MTSDSSTTPDTSSEQGKKRKMKTDVSEMIVVFMDMQKKQHDEFMWGEQLHHQQEKEMLDNWMKAQIEMEECLQQVQREEHQEANRMFQQMMNRQFEVMMHSFWQHTPSHSQRNHSLPLHYSYPPHEETPPANVDQCSQVYHNL